jgi:AcrR family transcriptional regulator
VAEQASAGDTEPPCSNYLNHHSETVKEIVARPRKASDEEIYEAAFRVMGRLGPAQWTLEDVAGEVGLTASALVQRFGSKRRLQLDLVRLFADGIGGTYEELRARETSPLAAVRAWADGIACLAESPEGLAHHLDYLRLDLTDPEMHVHFRRQAEAGRAFLRRTLAEAVAAGELPAGTDTDALARLVETVVSGSLFTWATYREGAADTWVRRDLELVLGGAAGG